MNIVIDANVYAYYFREEVLSEEPPGYGAAKPIFEQIPQRDIIYFDEKGIVKQEWLNAVNEEFTEELIASWLASGCAKLYHCIRDKTLESDLQKLRFPVRSRDIAYVRLSLAVVKSQKANCFLLSEDPDFYDPELKAMETSTKDKRILKRVGDVLRRLRNENIIVHSSATLPS